MQGRSWSATRSVRFRGEGEGGGGRGRGRGIVVALKPFLSRAHLPLSCVRRATGPSPLLSMAYRRDRDKRLGILNAQKPRYEYTRGRSKPLDPDVADVLVNAVVIFSVLGLPWLLDHSYWLPMGLGVIAFVPSVRSTGHQLLDILSRRLNKAWDGGRRGQTSNNASSEGEGGYYYEENEWTETETETERDRRRERATDSDSHSSEVERERDGERERGRSETGESPMRERRRGGGISMSRANVSVHNGRSTNTFSSSRRGRDSPPLFLRMLFSVFPFMRFWGGFL